jgi:hypothetical protein
VALYQVITHLEYSLINPEYAGGLAAGVTTPLDVAKTRIMLAEVCVYP